MIVLLLPGLALSQPARLQFQHVTMDRGLSYPDVNNICQDSVGFMWFGAYLGLNRFDGREVRSVAMQDVFAICADKKGNIWVGGSFFALHCINTSRDTIVSYDLIGVRALVLDDDGTLWIGSDKGLFHLEPITGVTTQMGEESLVGSGINSMAMDKQGNLWLITKSSIVRFNKKSRRGRLISPRNEQTNSCIAIAPGGMVWIANAFPYHVTCIDPRTLVLTDILENGRPVSANALAVSSSGTVYIATSGQGLKIYDPSTGNWQTYRHSESDPRSLSSNILNCVSFDRAGNLWVGTPNGVSWAARSHQGFTWVSALTADERMRPGTVQDIIEDGEGNLWIGAFGGLKKWDRKSSTVLSVKSVERRIGCLSIVGGNKLWIALAPGGGLFQLHTGGTELGDAEKLEWPGIKERITAMHCDGDTVMWAGCRSSTIHRLDIRTRKRTTYFYETSEQLFPNFIASRGGSKDCPRMIYRDRQGGLWIATSFGILSLNEGKGIFRRYVHSDTQNPSPWDNVWCVHEDSKGRFWVGSDLGLDLFDRTNGTFRPIIHSSGPLSGNTVVGIVEDSKGALWLQTDGMLLNYSHDTGELKRYGPEDGFPITHHGLFFVYGNSGSCLTHSGEIAIGLSDGFVLFRPDGLTNNPESSEKLVITGVEILGDSLQSGKNPISVFSLPTQPLVLQTSQNDLEFRFAGLDYSLPTQMKYAVWVEPMDHAWSNLGTQNSVRFMNLSPGSYRLRVKAANGDSAWSVREATYLFEILPPWWLTRLAYFLYTFCLIAIVFFAWKMQLRRVRTKQALEMTKFEAEKLHEVDEMKSRFFTNISHEFRTPLTLILGPVKQLAERLNDEKAREELGIVQRNARKLLWLVNELMDIAKLESGNMKLRAHPQNIVPLLKGLVVSFAPHAERKSITLKFSKTEDAIIVYIDREKIEKIITNILSNAFKFTPEGGFIELNVARDENTVNIRVSDTGIGISEENIPKIFDRFYQVNGSRTREEEGTGIGLALSKELIELHKGGILVDSEEGKGTAFTVRIPLGKEHLKPEEICDPAAIKEETSDLATELVSMDDKRTEKYDVDFVTEAEKPILLVVEDNADVRHYINGIVEKDFRLLEAADGEEGWNAATGHTPDIIISDIMMPKMDGFALCAKLKTDERTSHIPVILLTAKAASQDKIQGFETGADDYIMKPFEAEELKSRIRNLVEQRKRIQEHFRKSGILGFDDSRLMSIDKKFLQKLFHIISENISSASFNVESLAEMAGVSRSVLRRKIVSLTGELPVDLLRRIRLARAAELIEKNYGNMSEIALEVGFTNPSYFSECFRKQYGVAPSNYPRK